jgi:rod shape-determining protein MreC
LNGVGRFRKIWLWVFLIGFVLYLLSSNAGKRATWNPAEQLAIEITSPVQKLIHRTVHVTKGFWREYFYLVGIREENRDLKKQIRELVSENRRYREKLATHDRLKRLLQFKEAILPPALASQVIGRDPSGWFKSILIDKGKADGVSLNMPVVNASGVVGRIVAVSPNYAKALLIIDQNSSVDCLVQRSRDRGMLKGLSSERCKMDYVVKSSDVMLGDVVVTSGLGGVFPKGLPLGSVSRVEEAAGELFKDIEIEPVVDFSKLEEVLVILKEDESSLLEAEGR